MVTTIVPVSGGKDSQVVLSLALAQEENVVCIHQNTGYDHPDTYQQLRDMEKFYNVHIQHTESRYRDMFGFLEQAKYFPNSAARGCTQRLKQEPFARWLLENGYTKENSEIWFGMRSDESRTRNDKYGNLTHEDVFTLGDISSFYNMKKNQGIGEIPCRLPIVDWDTERVFSYLGLEGAPVNQLYARGHLRVGCYPCLLARKAEWVSAARDKTGREHLQKLIALEDKWREEGNPRKFIKVHRTWDVRGFLRDGGKELPEVTDAECGYCSI